MFKCILDNVLGPTLALNAIYGDLMKCQFNIFLLSSNSTVRNTYWLPLVTLLSIAWGFSSVNFVSAETEGCEGLQSMYVVNV